MCRLKSLLLIVDTSFSAIPHLFVAYFVHFKINGNLLLVTYNDSRLDDYVRTFISIF